MGGALVKDHHQAKCIDMDASETAATSNTAASPIVESNNSASDDAAVNNDASVAAAGGKTIPRDDDNRILQSVFDKSTTTAAAAIIDQEKVQKAISFLSNVEIRNVPPSEKRRYLTSKGMNQDEIDTALDRLATAPPKDGVDILKYNSPISHTFVLQMFMRNGSLNHYLNDYFNNIGLRYLSKEELFMFIKKCVMDFRIRRNQIVFYKWRRQDKLYNLLRDKFPQFKNNDITLLAELIEKSDEREAIFNSLGLEMPKKKKIRTGKKAPKKAVLGTHHLISLSQISPPSRRNRD